MSLADDFRKWALDPARTNDELFTVEIITEWGHRMWCGMREIYEAPDYEKDRAHKKERTGNPAYRPKIHAERIEHTIEAGERLKIMMHFGYQDRPIRDASAFRFFPLIEDLQLGCAEMRDLSPLANLPKLRKLRLHEPGLEGGHVTVDLSPLAGMATLESLDISLRAPWPDASALATLPALKILHFRGNAFALRDVPVLPAATVVILDPDFHFKTPLRDVRDLPEMPRVQRLKIDCVAALRGIERYPELRNLDLTGPFSDLTPLVALKNLTYLRLEGVRFLDLAPLARLPGLREILLVRERPLDLSPLAEAPMLSEVNVERCTILKTELSAICAGLLPWGPDFLAPEPRPVAPLRAITYHPQHEELKTLYTHGATPDTARDEFYGDDLAFSHAESRWFQKELVSRLTALLGSGWGASGGGGALPGHHQVSICRYRDVMRLPEIVQTLRELLATCRFPWKLMLDIQPHGDLAEDMEQIRERHEEEEGDWLERCRRDQRKRGYQDDDDEDFYRRRRELYERYEREHRMRLLEQQGAEIKPEDFSTTPPDPRPGKVTAGPAPAQNDSDDEDDDLPFEINDEDDEGGGIAEPPPPPPEGSASDLGEKLRCIVTLDERHLWITSHMLENAEYLFCLRAEDWHKLPEPIQDRPRPY